MDMDMVAVGSVVTFMPALRVRNILFVIKSHVTLCYPRTLRPWLPLSVVGSEAITLSYGLTVATGPEPKCCSISVTTNYLPAQWMRLVI